MLKIICHTLSSVSYILNYFQSISLLVCRICVAEVFWKAGVTKIGSFDKETWFSNSSTIELFKYEYKTPMGAILPDNIYLKLSSLMTPVLAANLGAFIELFFPILLLIGFGARIPAFVLFLFNFVAATSYPAMWQEGGAALTLHSWWGIALLVLMSHGHGKFSIDAILKNKCSKYLY